MFKNSLITRFLFAILVPFIIGCLVTLFTFSQTINKIKSHIYHDEYNNLKSIVKISIDQRKDTLLASAVVFSEMPTLKKLLLLITDL